MQKFSISIDVSRIQKSRLRQNKFTTKDGKEIVQNLCDVVGIPLTEKKLIKSGDNWKMYKTGFLVEKGAKDEATNILGDIMEFENNEQENYPKNTNFPNIEDENESDLPF